MSDEIKKIDEISETQNAPEIKKEKKTYFSQLANARSVTSHNCSFCT